MHKHINKRISRAITAYKAAVLSRTTPDLRPDVRAEIGRLFPDTAGEIDRAWVRLWWIACSICFATLWAQRNRNRRPSEIRTTRNTASTAISCSGQGTPVQPRRGRLYFFPASDRTLFHPGFSAIVYSM
uniref:RxLR effector candidate protein n=1 Tax=Hyaloperonospora arabidopsidis (strain Emoy2) TaxID=559515 RepID=M4BPN3_HYAAE